MSVWPRGTSSAVNCCSQTWFLWEPAVEGLSYMSPILQNPRQGYEKAPHKFRTGRLCRGHWDPYNTVSKEDRRERIVILPTHVLCSEWLLLEEHHSGEHLAPCLVWVTEPKISVEEKHLSIPGWQWLLLGQPCLWALPQFSAPWKHSVSGTTCSQGLHKEERFLAKRRAAPSFSRPLCPISFLHRKLPERLLGRKRLLLKGRKGAHTGEGMHMPSLYNFFISKEQRNSRCISDVFTWKLQYLLMLLRSYFTSVDHRKKSTEYLAVS